MTCPSTNRPSKKDVSFTETEFARINYYAHARVFGATMVSCIITFLAKTQRRLKCRRGVAVEHSVLAGTATMWTAIPTSRSSLPNALLMERNTTVSFFYN